MTEPEITEWQQLKRHVLGLQESLILWALEETGGDKSAASRLIGVHRRQLQRIYNRWKDAQ